MKFVIRMALREIRASWQRLLFFFVCIAIGVGSIVALRSVIQSVRVALAGEARTLLGADVALTTNRPWSDAVLKTLDDGFDGLLAGASLSVAGGGRRITLELVAQWLSDMEAVNGTATRTYRR